MSDSITQFTKFITGGTGVRLVKFSTPTCHPCKLIEPEIQKLEAQGVKVLRLDASVVDSDLLDFFGVSSVPTVIVYSGGKHVDTITGSKVGVLEARIRDLLGAA